MNKALNNEVFNYILITLYLLVGFVPNFTAIDKVAPQFLYLSILNIFTLIYLISTLGFFEVYRYTFKKNFVVFLLFLFWAWGLLSLLHAINKSEVLIESSRILVYIYSYINLLILIKWAKIDLKKVSILFSIILGMEVLSVFIRFYGLYISNYDSSNILGRNLELKAFTGNINITAFTMALKTPFLIFLMYKSEKRSFYLKTIILGITFFTIFILGSRGANITTALIVTIIAILGMKNAILNKKLSLLVIGAFFLGIAFNSVTFRNDDSLNYITRTSNVLDTSSQKRLGYYKFAIKSILNNPFLGIGLGNWKIYSIKSESQVYDDYQIPFHVHNDYLEVATETGIIGMLLFFGIYIYIFLGYIKFFRRPKIPEKDKVLGIISIIGLFVYLCDSFLNFPFTRPVMQVPNLFLFGLSIYLITKNDILLFPKLKINFKENIKYLYMIFLPLGLIFSIYISYQIFISFKQQQFLIATTRSITSNYGPDDVYKINSKIPNITVHTVPIDALKATLLMRLDMRDSILKFVNNGNKANPFIGYPDLVKSLYFIGESEIDSGYKYSKKAYNTFQGAYNHFDHFMNMIEFKRDSIELTKIYENLKDNYSKKRYVKYLQTAARVKNNLTFTDKELIERLSVNNPLNSVNKAFTIMGEIGRENIEKGYTANIVAERYYNQKDFINAAKFFLEASQYNPLEIAYFENAANSYMKANENKKAITILEKSLTELNPKSGKTEYLLGIIYLDMDQSVIGCEYLYKAREKGFSFPDQILNQFCNKVQKQKNKNKT